MPTEPKGDVDDAILEIGGGETGCTCPCTPCDCDDCLSDEDWNDADEIAEAE